MKDDETVEADESVEDERPTKAKSAQPTPPYGSNIPTRWRHTPFNDLPENLQAVVAKES